VDSAIYAPPTADLSKTGPGNTADGAFYVVSRSKFAILYLCTLSFYAIYWHYKQWAMFQEHQRKIGNEPDLWPVVRALFPIFFVFDLLQEADRHAASHGRVLNWNWQTHSGLLITLMVLTGVLSRVSGSGIGNPYTDLAWLASFGLACMAYDKAQRNINSCCGDSASLGNDTLSWANYAWIGLGLFGWLGVSIEILESFGLPILGE
jgi:hypothetical protein